MRKFQRMIWQKHKNILLIFCHINNIMRERERYIRKGIINEYTSEYYANQIHDHIFCFQAFSLASFVVHEYIYPHGARSESTLQTHFKALFYYYFTIHSSHGVDDVEKTFLITKSWKNVWADCTTMKSVDANSAMPDC